jgi:integrase
VRRRDHLREDLRDQGAIPAFLVKELEKLMEGRQLGDLLFTAPEGGTLMLRNFMRRQFKAALEATALAELGITPRTAAYGSVAGDRDRDRRGREGRQTMPGHKTSTLTLDTYGHLWPDRLDEVSDRLDTQRPKALEEAKKKAEKAATGRWSWPPWRRGPTPDQSPSPPDVG